MENSRPKLIPQPHQFKGLFDAHGRKLIPEFTESYNKYSNDTRLNYLNLPSPKKIVEYLNDYVLGQNEAKRTVSVAMKNMEYRINFPHLERPKSNVLISGNTGCGKTHLIKTLANFSNIPVLELKMTDFSTKGFVGDTMDDRFNQLIDYSEIDADEVSCMIQNNAFDEIPFVENAEFAIVYLDEIDKIATTNKSFDTGSFGKGLQNELIGMIEDSTVLNGALSTKNMLFIGTGAFVGLESIISKRLNKKNSIGFQTGNFKTEKDEQILGDNLLLQAKPEDFIKYGFLPELVGRFPTSSHIRTLSEQDLVKILEMENSYLGKQVAFFEEVYRLDLKFTTEAKSAIAKYAKNFGTNARALQSAIDIVLEPIFFEPEESHIDRRILIDEKVVMESLKL